MNIVEITSYEKVTEFLSIDPTTIIATLLNTLILFLILKHFLFNKVNQVINDRREEVANSYEEANETKVRAAKLENEYTEKLALAKEESAQILKDSAKKAQKRSEEIVDEAHKEAQGIIDKAHSEIELEKKRAVNQVKDEITDIAFSAAAAVVGKEISKEDNDKLIESFINDVSE